MKRGYLSFPEDREYNEDGASFTVNENGLTIEVCSDVVRGSYNIETETTTTISLDEALKLYEWLGAALKSETC